MSETRWKKYSLSTDEYALCLSLIGRADLGKLVLQEIYPHLKESQIEERMVAASHSLMSRELVWIRENGTIALNEDLEKSFLPQLRFVKMLQVMINETGMEEPTVTNIYISERGQFTANRVVNGVVQLIWHGDSQGLLELISSWVKLNKPTAPAFPPELQMFDLQTLAQLPDLSVEKAKKLLLKKGIHDPWLSELTDLTEPLVRGSVVLLNVNSDKISEANFEDANASVLFVEGQKYCWLFQFDAMNDRAVGQMVNGSQTQLIQEVSKLIG